MIVAVVLTAAAVLVGLWGLDPARRTRRRRDPSAWLQRAGSDVSPGRFLATSLGAGAAAFLLVMGVTGVPLVALPPAVACAAAPGVFLSRRRARHLEAVAAEWPDALRDLSASVQAGMSLPRALEHLADHGPAAIRVAMTGYRSMARTIGVVPALEVMRERIADPTADRVIEVLRVAYERGGSAVPDLLDALAEGTVEDLRVDEEIRTESLEQRINARIVFVLPWLVLVVLAARPGPFRDFYASASGLPVVVIGALLSGVGVTVVGRMARRQVEPRVLGGGR